MFQYKYVLNEATGIRYYIISAALDNDEGPDEEVDWYTISLSPADDYDASPIYDISLIVHHVEGKEIPTITKGLDPRHISYPIPNRTGYAMMNNIEVKVQGDTLIVPAE